MYFSSYNSLAGFYFTLLSRAKFFLLITSHIINLLDLALYELMTERKNLDYEISLKQPNPPPCQNTWASLSSEFSTTAVIFHSGTLKW